MKNFFFKGSVVDKLLRCALISKALLHLQVLSPKKKISLIENGGKKKFRKRNKARVRGVWMMVSSLSTAFSFLWIVINFPEHSRKKAHGTFRSCHLRFFSRF